MPSLLCTTADGASFTVRPGPGLASGFLELGLYRLAFEHGSHCELVLDDVALPCKREATRHEWEWQPGFYAGTVVAELFDGDGVRLCAYRLDVAPEPDKLGQPVFQAMVDELLAVDPQLLYGAETAQHAIGADGDIANVHLEYARLKLFGPQLLQALRQVCSHPLTRLCSERSRQPAHRVRRFDHQTVRTIATDPLLLATLRDGEYAGASLDRMLFDVAISRDELDTPAHRTLLSILMSVIRRIRSVRDALILLAAADRPEQVRTAMTPRLAVRVKLLDELEVALHKVCKAPPFSEVSRREVSAAGLNVIAGHPSYARAYRGGWQILRPGIDGHDADEMLPVSPTWEIYERWCFLRVVEALRQVFPALAWSRHYAGSKADRVYVEGSADGVSVRAQLQARFAAMDNRARDARFYSISAERQPDIVVTCTTSDTRRFFVFDAKYSVSRDRVLKAMQSAHIYRDSLRWDSHAPDGSFLFVPAGGGAAWLEAPAFHAEHGVGVIPLSIATGADRLAAILAAALLG